MRCCRGAKEVMPGRDHRERKVSSFKEGGAIQRKEKDHGQGSTRDGGEDGGQR